MAGDVVGRQRRGSGGRGGLGVGVGAAARRGWCGRGRSSRGVSVDAVAIGAAFVCDLLERRT